MKQKELKLLCDCGGAVIEVRNATVTEICGVCDECGNIFTYPNKKE
jgi:hypothetical protein